MLSYRIDDSNRPHPQPLSRFSGEGNLGKSHLEAGEGMIVRLMVARETG